MPVNDTLYRMTVPPWARHEEAERRVALALIRAIKLGELSQQVRWGEGRRVGLGSSPLVPP
jgi:hypothetical protein